MKSAFLSAAKAVQRVVSRQPADILPPISRDDFRAMIPANALEIGPFANPFLDHADYYDVLDSHQLRARAIELGLRPDDCPEIHFSGNLADIPRRYSSVFSSHVIEHQPDLIAHLEDVSRLLVAGGAYYLAIPDKRYCFDHFLDETTLPDVLAARGRTRHPENAVRDHRINTTHNIAPLHWFGIHGGRRKDFATFAIDQEAIARGEYVDVHSWTFTPVTFRSIVLELGIFNTVTVYDTAFGGLEFMAVLSGRGGRSPSQ